MGQCLLYLIQSFDWCGTFLGLFVLNSEFCRLFVPHRGEILVEMASRKGTAMTVSDFCRASGMEDLMAHDLLNERGINDEELKVLWDFIALVRTIVTVMPDPLPDSVPRADAPVDKKESVCLETDSPSSLVSLLELAAKAHPQEFPSWWATAKREILLNGEDTPVPPEAYRKRQKRSAGSKVSTEGDLPSNDGRGRGGGRGGQGGTDQGGTGADGGEDGAGDAGGQRAQSGQGDTGAGSEGHPQGHGCSEQRRVSHHEVECERHTEDREGADAEDTEGGEAQDIPSQQGEFHEINWIY